eukprot:SAG22_NODE_207_length_15278_cov_4.056855_3_plen_163_part_00
MAQPLKPALALISTAVALTAALPAGAVPGMSANARLDLRCNFVSTVTTGSRGPQEALGVCPGADVKDTWVVGMINVTSGDFNTTTSKRVAPPELRHCDHTKQLHTNASSALDNQPVFSCLLVRTARARSSQRQLWWPRSHGQAAAGAARAAPTQHVGRLLSG